MRALVLVLTLAGVSNLWAQNVALTIDSGSGQPGSSVALPISISSSGGAQPTAVQWTFSYGSGIAGVDVQLSSQVSGAPVSKLIQCAEGTCLVFGLNTTVIPNGTLATATFQLSPTASGQIAIQLTNVVASSTSSIPATGGSGTISVNTPAPAAALNSVGCSPATIPTPGSATCTVNLTAAAPAGGFTVNLSDNHANLSVPSSVTVGSSQTSATFTATATAVATDQGAVVTASAGGVTRTANLTLSAPAALSSLTCAASSLTSGQNTNCTVTLTKASSGTTTVGLSDNSAQLSTPASVNVGNGQTSAQFTVTAGTITASQSATVTASLNSVTRTSQINLVAPASLSGLSCTPTTFSAAGTSNCTVSLSAAASSNTTVALSDNNPNVTVPSSVTVNSGQSSAQFTATVTGVPSDSTATITASLSGGSQTATLTLSAPAALSSLSCATGSMTSGQSTNCTVTLTKASAGTTTVGLSDNSGQLTTPASVNVGNGQTSAQFTATAGTVATSQSVTVTASLSGVTRTAQINLVAPAGLSGLSCAPTTFNAAGTATCTVSLSSPASTNTAVALSDNNPNVTVPSSVTVNSGQSSAQFSATVTGVPSDSTATITASLNGGSQTATLTLSAPAALSSLACVAESLTSGQSTNCTVTLTKASAGTTTVGLSDNSGQLTTPASVNVGDGQTSAQFNVTAGTITTSQSVTVTASLSGVSRTDQINLVAPAGLSGLSCSPNSFTAAGTANCTVNLSAAAASNTTITLSDNSPNVTVPANVTINSGQSSAQFTANVTGVPSDSTVTITASLNGGSQTATLTLSAGSVSSLSSISCASATLASSESTTCTVTLTNPSAGASTVAVSDNSGQLTTPTSVSIADGQTSAQFTASAGTITVSLSVTITASLNGVTRTQQINLVAPAGLSSLSCTPTALGSGQQSVCTVALTSSAAQATALSVSSNNPLLSVPPTATIPATATSTQFTVTAQTLTTDATAQVTVSLAGGTLTATLNLTGSNPSLSSLICAPVTLRPGESATCTAQLDRAAVTPVPVALASNNPDLTVPASVSIPAGATQASFTAAARMMAPAGSAQLQASYGANTVSASIEINPSAPVSKLLSFECTPASLPSGATTECTVWFRSPLDTETTVEFSSSSSLIYIPAQMTVAAGTTTFNLSLVAGLTPTTQDVLLGVTLDSSDPLVQSIKVQPAPSLSLDVPSTIFVRAGNTVSFDVQLAAGAPAATIVAKSLPSGASFSDLHFNWLPNASQVGEHTISVEANSSQAIAGSASVRIVVRPENATIEHLVNPAALTPSATCSPNSLMTILGKGFALSDPEVASLVPLPSKLGGVRLMINSQDAPLWYVSDNLVHFSCPDLPPGTPLALVLEYEDGLGGTRLTAPLDAEMRAATPAIYTLSGDQAAVLIAGTGLVAGPPTEAYPTRPAHVGEYIEIFGNGMGAATAPVAAGEPAPLDQLIYSTATVLVDFGGGLKVPAAFAGLTPGSFGLFQVNVPIPGGVQTGSAVPITLEMHLPDGTVVRSNTAKIAVQ